MLIWKQWISKKSSKAKNYHHDWTYTKKILGRVFCIFLQRTLTILVCMYNDLICIEKQFGRVTDLQDPYNIVYATIETHSIECAMIGAHSIVCAMIGAHSIVCAMIGTHSIVYEMIGTHSIVYAMIGTHSIAKAMIGTHSIVYAMIGIELFHGWLSFACQSWNSPALGTLDHSLSVE